MRKLPKLDKFLCQDVFNNCYKPALFEIAKNVFNNSRSLDINEDNITNHLIKTILKEYEIFDNMQLKPLINATGIVVHTNLGRSVISQELLDRAKKNITSYSNLEYDIKSAKRANRNQYTSKLLSLLLNLDKNGYKALFVNNNASAVFLILNTISKNLKTVVSRGELVEIGGSFRIPEVMKNSGTILVEVGTTNITRLQDYAEKIDEDTALLMKVHQSNFSIDGFSKSSNINQIASLAKDNKILSYYDLGSAYLSHLPYNLSKYEDSLINILQSNVDILSFSADKLFGSVQCGIIIAKNNIADKIFKNQLFRMFRVDKITLSILNETIKAYLNKEFNLITTQNLIFKDLKQLEKMAHTLKNIIDSKTQNMLNTKIIKTKTFIGGGAMPCKAYDSVALAFDNAKLIEEIFRKHLVIGRIENQQFLIDFRSIDENSFNRLIEILDDIIKELDT